MFRFIVTQCLVLVILVSKVYSIDRIEVELCENCSDTSYKLVNLTLNDDLVKLQAPQKCAFFIIQVHHQLGESVLSYEPFANRIRSVRGNNLGLVQLNNGSSYTFYSLNQFNGTKVLFALTSYTAKAPIPGGCNMEFNTTIAPYLNVTYDNNLRVVEFQKSSIRNATCETQNTALDLYYTDANFYDFSEASYFKLIINMLTVENITKYGLLTLRPYQGPELRRLFSNYIGVGVAYNAIAYGAQGSAAYVPCVSYGRIPGEGYDTNLLDFTIFFILYAMFSEPYLNDEITTHIVVLQLVYLLFWITAAIIIHWNLSQPFYFRYGIAFLLLPLLYLCAIRWRRECVNVNLTLTIIALLYSYGLPEIAMFYNYSLWLLLAVAFPLWYLLTHHMHTRLANCMMSLLPLLILFDPGQRFYAYIDIVRGATVHNFWMATRPLPFISWTTPLLIGAYVCLCQLLMKFFEWCIRRVCRRRNYLNLDDSSSSSDDSSD